MKKKPPEPAPAPAPKAPDPAAKQPAPPASAPKAGEGEKKAPEAPTPAPAEQGKDLSEVPVQTAEKPPAEMPSETTDATGGGAKSEEEKKKATKPADPIDWLAMRQPFLDRGVPLSGRDGEQIQQNWTMTYNNMVNIGLDPALAVKITNIGVPVAYGFAMARDNPTQIEKFDAETEKMLPQGKKLGKVVVPIITPDTLSFAIEKVSGKKIDFRF